MLMDMVRELHDGLQEELEGVGKYMRMASEAELAGYPKLAHCLHKMAHEEFHHAWYIFETGKRHGLDVSPECWRKIKEYKEML